MPSTINGIGTRYVGRGRLSRRRATCASCGRVEQLASYDTRLWFTVVWLPLLPLRAERVVDHCPACTRHRAVPLKEWRRQRDQTIARVRAQFAADRRDGALAARLHRTLVDFAEFDAADRLRAEISDEFRGDAALQLEFGSALLGQGRRDEAVRHFERAIEADSECEGARVELARERMSRGDLDEAWRLLSFLLFGGDDAHLWALAELGCLLARDGDPHRALQALTLSIKRSGPLGRHERVRRAVRRAERRAGRRTDVLPPRERNPVALLGASLGLLVLAAGVVWFDRSLASSREVNLVSGVEGPVTVVFGDAAPVVLAPGQRRVVEVPEGRHVVSVTGALEDSRTVRIGGDLLARWRGGTEYVFNVGGSALLVLDSVTYSSVRDGSHEPRSWRLLFGEDWSVLQGVDFAFVEFPEELHVSGSRAEVRRHRLRLVRDPMSAILPRVAARDGGPPALALGEWHLRWHPSDREALDAYLAQAARHDQWPRARATLERLCALRPVSVPAHELLQEVRADEGTYLREQYDAALDAEPANADLLYLRGRLEARHSAASTWFERALALDAEHPWAHAGLARGALGRGEPERALAHAQACVRARPRDGAFRALLHQALVGTSGESEALIAAQQDLGLDPFDFDALLRRAEAQLAAGERDAARRDLERSAALLAAQDWPDAARAAGTLRALAAYARGDLDEAASAVRATGDAFAPGLLHQALAAAGRVAEADALTADAGGAASVQVALTLAVAWRLEDDAARADAWWGRAVAALAAGDPRNERLAALLLASSTGPGDLRDLDADMGLRALAALWLAYADVERAEAWRALARDCDLGFAPPHRFVQRALE